MKMRSLTLIALTALAAVGAACGATSNGGTPTATTPPTSPTPGTKIHDIQSGVIASNSTVTLTGIVVTAIHPGGNGYDFYAQDVGGGQYSGIYFFDKNAKTDPSIAVGDVVSVTGAFQEYYQSGSTFSTSEIIPSTMTIDNPGGGTPVADDVTTADLKNTVAEPWEGCLVNVTGAPAVSTVGLGFGEYGVGTEKIHVNNVLFDTFEPRLVGEHMTKLVGVVDYSFKNFHVDPRDSNDITGDGTNTPVSLSIASLMTGNGSTYQPGQLVTVTNVVVGGLSPYQNSQMQNKMSFWAQDSTTGAANSGIYFNDVFYKNPPNLAVGSTVTLTGKFLEFGTTTKSHEIDFGYSDHLTVMVAAGTAPTPMVVPVASLHGAGAAQYEGLLISVTDGSMTVQTAPNSFKEYNFGTNSTNSVWVGTLAGTDTSGNKVGPNGATPGTAVTSGTGPVYYGFGHYYIEPRTAGDIN